MLSSDDQWDPNLPELPSTVLRLEVKNYNINDSLSVDYLSTLKSLRELKLTSLSLTSLSNLTFSNLSNLERLDLSLNQITSLEAGIFTATSYNLKYLDLSFNQLTSIDELFIGCVALEHLNLQSNQLTNLTINTFLGLVKLTYLNLDDNFITTIELGSFLHLTRLGHLIISNNPISPATRFDSLSTHLKYVDVSNISLTSIPHGISPFIRDLRLSGNQISSLASGDLDNYLYLNVLVLDSNGLSEIQPDSLGRLEYLIKFWCKHNALTTLPSDLPSSLRELYLSNNAFTNLNLTLFTYLVNLERLDLSANAIVSIEPTVFTHLVNLVELNLSKNKLLNLANLELPASLKHLDLSSNQMVNFAPQIFQSTPNLEHLSLSNTTLNKVTFDESTNKCIYLEHLKSLNLDKSYPLSEHFLKLLTSSCENSSNTSLRLIVPNLSELHLIGNHLSSLGANLISKLPYLLTLSFDSDRIDCSLEDNVNLSKWLTRPNVLIKPSKESIKCWLPQQVRHLPLIKLNATDQQSNNLATINLALTMENNICRKA
uniref:LRRCT domain-containing protein n=1 Tax=Tetranychus urticae TaxID=32264 RepID=T1L336_TETUR